MKIAIIERIEYYEKESPFATRYYLDSYFKEIFDQLNILLIPIIGENHLEDICEMCDALIITGSFNDVHPKYYNQTPLEDKLYKNDEFPVVKKAIDLFAGVHKPILGICAGLQEINVAFGGSLNQLIDNHRLDQDERHLVDLNENSFLQMVYNKKRIEVNSFHKQCIDTIAPGLLYLQ